MPATVAAPAAALVYIPLHDHLHDHIWHADAASDPHQSGLHHRQGPVRAPDHLVRLLGDLYPLRLFPGALAGHRHRHGRRRQYPRGRSAAAYCSRPWNGCARSSAAPSTSSRSSSSASSTRCSHQLIDRDLLDQEAARLRLEVSDEVIRSAIYDNPAFRGPDGRFDRGLFNQVLMMNRLTEDQLIARLHRDMPRADLLQAITAGVTLPRPVVETLYRYRNEKRLADIVAFPVAGVKDVGQPSDADLTKFYEAHPDLFRAPEYRAFTVASLAPERCREAGGDIPENKVREEYEQRKDEFETPEQREVQQILSPSEEKAKEAEAALDAGQGLEGGRHDDRQAGSGDDRSRADEAPGHAAASWPMSRSNCRSTSPAIRSRRRSAGTSCASSRSSRPRRRPSSRPSRRSRPSWHSRRRSTASKSSATRSTTRSPAARRSPMRPPNSG